jgi:hypothetical protein
MSEIRTPYAVLRSLKVYVAGALDASGDDWDTRFADEEGTFDRPFAQITPAGEAVAEPGTHHYALLQPFSIHLYPEPGEDVMASVTAAYAAAELLERAVLVGSGEGYPRRIPLWDWDEIGPADEVPDRLVYEGPSVRRDHGNFATVRDFSARPMRDEDDPELWLVAGSARLRWIRTGMTLPVTPLVDHVGLSPDPE